MFYSQSHKHQNYKDTFHTKLAISANKEATGEDDKKATVKDDTRETNDADKKASILTNKTVKMI